MVDIAKIEKLMTLMKKHEFDVLHAESAGEKVSLARNAAHSHFLQPQAAMSANTGASSRSVSSHESSSELPEEHHSVASSPAAPAKAENALPAGETITSPFVGTFYRSPSPDSTSFVEVGSRVKKGQSLCIVEAMKLMNEIECEVEGEIVAILIDNAKPVEFGTPLFIIAPSK